MVRGHGSILFAFAKYRCYLETAGSDFFSVGM